MRHLVRALPGFYFVFYGPRRLERISSTDVIALSFTLEIGNLTEVTAARKGKVVEVEVRFDGIGINANFITIEHKDGQRSVYAHIKHNGALVKVGDEVLQGQTTALSGMVGQAPGPHLHFYVVNKEGTSSIPISFQEVQGGVPLAGHFYTSENAGK